MTPISDTPEGLSSEKKITIFVVAAMIAFGVWTIIFPHIFWFIRLWCSVVVANLGLWFAEKYYLIDVLPRSLSRGKAALLIFGVATFVLVVPYMWSQENTRQRLRLMPPHDVIQLSIVGSDKKYSDVVASGAERDEFVKLLRDAELFYPNHEGSLENFELLFMLADDSLLRFPARIPEDHPRDLSIDFRAWFATAHIIIPNGADWLKQARADGPLPKN